MFLENFSVVERGGDNFLIGYSGSEDIVLSDLKIDGISESISKNMTINYGRGEHIPFDAKVGLDFYYGLWSRKMRGEVRSVMPVWSPI